MKKVKISIQGNEFLIPSTSIQKCSYDNETYVHMRAKLCASIIKQYVKKNFPNLKVWAGSDVYSGGSSVRVEVCNEDGSKVNPIDFEKISEWKSILQGGSFDGMYDIYNYREDSPTTDKGTSMKYFPSYVFVENKPKWGTPEYWLNQWNELKDNYVNGNDFLNQNKTYMTDKEFEKVSNLNLV